MDDDRLALELQRRASGASPRPDWVQRDLLPAVWRQIDARPQPVLVSRWSPLAGVATLVVALLVLVVAVPRLGPQPPSATSTPANPLVMSTADFASRLAAGELDGKTVPVDGGIVAYDGPPIFGSYCGPNGPACIVGQLEGVTPRVVVSSPDIAVASSNDSTLQHSPGWPWWARVSPPIHGTLLLSVGDAGGVTYFGRALLDGNQLTWSVGHAAALDLNLLERDQLVLVDGWLVDTEPPGSFVYLDCRPRQFPDLDGLPSRYCQPADFLSSEQPTGEVVPDSAARLQVQRAAAKSFGGRHATEPATFAIAPRLYGGGCSAAPPCWLWNVVARLDPTAGPSPIQTPSAQPAGSAVLSTADFAARRAAGELDGTTVLVNGRIDPEFRLGPVCLPIDWSCFMGVLSGADPPVDVNWRWVPATTAEANRTYDYTRTGWQSWYQAQAPIEGVLVLSVDGSGQVNLIGVARDSEEGLTWLVTNAATVDINSLSPDDVVLVKGWLVETEPPGTTIDIDCMSPDFPRVDGLPYDYCQPHDYLSSDQPVGTRGVAPEAAARLLVQRNAAQLFGALIQDGTSLFAIAPRLYGGCLHAATCWQWDVVARVDDLETFTPTPLPTSTSPEPTVSPTAAIGCEWRGWYDPQSTEGSPEPAPSLLLPPPVFIDQTGLVASCFSTDRALDNFPVPVIDAVSDLGTRYQINWTTTACDTASTVTFARVGDGFTIEIDRGTAEHCDGISHRMIAIELREPVDYRLIDLARSTPQPTQSPAPPAIQCNGPGIEVSVLNPGDLVIGCRSPQQVVDPKPGVEVIADPVDPTLVRIQWDATICTQEAWLTLTGSSDHAVFEISPPATCILSAARIVAVEVVLTRPVEVSAVRVVWDNAFPSP